jgi:outer membrane immunogenic protein
VGFAIDRWLAYVTGGLAWSQVSVSGLYGSGTFYGGPAGSNSISITQAASAHDRHTLLGGTGGVGLEYALTNNLSIGAEFRYTEFDPETYKLGAIPFPGMTTSSVTAHVDEPTNEVTMRLNYRFAAR